MRKVKQTRSSNQKAMTIFCGFARSSPAFQTNRLSEVASDSRLTDLGFDSLMFVELQGAVEDGGGRVLSPDELNEVQTVRELLTAVQRVDKTKRIADEPKG